ncbi:dephospho-CoA kinase [Schauerella aestuarii]|uniref:dephospho-CoA kinase n=1 Tax=Schauerella aestuarii TaxID=2511204 RepID=UPI001369B355|nr:dephospho-CoA kinase [Achromobacter aestuarii]MYZ44289.1 dephospho-CoA kinase [Achromobacter aestuarii]
MFKIGLTGGIGSGKSSVARWLAEWGAAVIDTDDVAHSLTAPGGAAIDGIRAHFGAQAIAADGAMDRAWMRERVFAAPEVRRELEAILHPLIGRETEAQATAATGLYLVYVVPLLVESGRWRNRVDRICVVDCDPPTQVARVVLRSGLTEDTIRRIMAAQASRDDRLAAADDVIDNGGDVTTAQLKTRVQALHDRWCADARG